MVQKYAHIFLFHNCRIQRKISCFASRIQVEKTLLILYKLKYVIIPINDNILKNLYLKANTGTTMPSQICGDVVMDQWSNVFYSIIVHTLIVDYKNIGYMFKYKKVQTTWTEIWPKIVKQLARLILEDQLLTNYIVEQLDQKRIALLFAPPKSALNQSLKYEQIIVNLVIFFCQRL